MNALEASLQHANLLKARKFVHEGRRKGDGRITKYISVTNIKNP